MAEVTLIIAIYNNDIGKILITLRSVIIQKNINIRIIIADDGSKNDYFGMIKAYLAECKFDNYLILRTKSNMGTVKNILRCQEYCQGKYVKSISPGDFFCDELALRKWVNYLKDGDYLVSFCDAYYYSINDVGEPNLIKTYANPQYPDVFNKGNNNYDSKKRVQLLFNDYWLGAATLVEKNIFFGYLADAATFVKYAEDGIYRLMCANNEKIVYFPQTVIAYEYGTGISAPENQNGWHNVLMHEWEDVSRIVADMLTNKTFKKKFMYTVSWKMKNLDIQNIHLSLNNFVKILIRLLPLYFHVPEIVGWHLQLVLHRRYTKTILSNEEVITILRILNTTESNNG